MPQHTKPLVAERLRERVEGIARVLTLRGSARTVKSKLAKLENEPLKLEPPTGWVNWRMLQISSFDRLTRTLALTPISTEHSPALPTHGDETDGVGVCRLDSCPYRMSEALFQLELNLAAVRLCKRREKVPR